MVRAASNLFLRSTHTKEETATSPYPRYLDDADKNKLMESNDGADNEPTKKAELAQLLKDLEDKEVKRKSKKRTWPQSRQATRK